MGAAQAISGFVLGIIFALGALFSKKAAELSKRSFSHVAHGLGNIAAGALEAIPFIGTVSFAYRYAILKEDCVDSLSDGLAESSATLNITKWMSYTETGLDDAHLKESFGFDDRNIVHLQFPTP